MDYRTVQVLCSQEAFIGFSKAEPRQSWEETYGHLPPSSLVFVDPPILSFFITLYQSVFMEYLPHNVTRTKGSVVQSSWLFLHVEPSMFLGHMKAVAMEDKGASNA